MLRRLLLVFAVSLSLLAGCSSDILDVNRRTLLFAIGADYDSLTRQYVVTYAYYNLTGQSGSSASVGSSGGSTGSPPLTSRSEKGRTVEDAISRIEDGLPAQSFYGATRLVVLGQGLLRHGARDAVYAIAALREVPWRAFVAATVEDASTFLSMPEALQQRPLDSMLQSRPKRNVALRPSLLYSTVSHASETSSAALVPLISVAANRVDYLGQAVLQAGREVATVPAADAPLILPLVSSGPAVYRADLPGWSANPVILHARSAGATVVTDSDGSVTVRLNLLGTVGMRARLTAAGFSDSLLERRIGSVLAARLATRLLTLVRAGVDPRALADQPSPKSANLSLRTEVSVTLDRNQDMS